MRKETIDVTGNKATHIHMHSLEQQSQGRRRPDIKFTTLQAISKGSGSHINDQRIKKILNLYSRDDQSDSPIEDEKNLEIGKITSSLLPDVDDEKKAV